MAVPVITNILPVGSTVGDPVEGPTAGRSLVLIFGDGFRLPPDPPPDGPTGPVVAGRVTSPSPKTVSVTFGGREALKVDVVRTNLLHVVTPISPVAANKANNHGAADVDVVITNLDDDGDPIGGETVTRVDGYTYRRPQLDATNSSDFLRLIEAMIEEWKRQVLPEVVFTVHTDFDDDTSSPIVDIAKLPMIALILREVPENRFYSTNERPEIESGGVVQTLRKPRTIDLLFDVVGASDSTMELMNLLAAANTFMEENIVIELDRDPADLSKGRVEYELDFQVGGDFAIGRGASNSNLRQFSGAIVVRGFDIEGFTGFSSSAVRDLGVLTNDDESAVSLDVEATSG